jgi:PKD repeat protein
MNALLTGLGGHMSLDSNFVDAGFGATTRIGPSPLTAGVSSIQYAGASTITVTAPATGLVRSRTTGVPIAAAESLDGGLFVLLGDSNMINDNSSDGYTAHDNGALMRNLCPPDDSLGVASQPVSATEGQPFTATVASTSGDPDSAGSDHTISIDWGDGSTSPGSVEASGNITGTHTYAEAGSYTVTTTVTDGDSPSNAASASSTATVADAPLAAGQLSAGGGSEGVGGASAAFTFADANPDAAASDFQATVDWGDGTSAGATVTQNPDGSFLAVPTVHTYSEEGTYAVKMVVTDSGGSQTSITQKVRVTDAPLTASGMALNSQLPFAGTLASITDDNPSAGPSDFAATVDWGDGTSSNATLSRRGNAFEVSGSHTYAQTGLYTVSVHVTDQGGSAATAASQLLIWAFAAGNGGSFVIGDGSAQVGFGVDFWGSRWAAQNLLTSGSAPAGFRGFAAAPSSNQPACGGTYASGPGNSSSPPATVPAYMGVYVSSAMSNQGPRITGNIAHIDVVRTGSGYRPDPGQEGSGQVVAQVC